MDKIDLGFQLMHYYHLLFHVFDKMKGQEYELVGMSFLSIL